MDPQQIDHGPDASDVSPLPSAPPPSASAPALVTAKLPSPEAAPSALASAPALLADPTASPPALTPPVITKTAPPATFILRDGGDKQHVLVVDDLPAEEVRDAAGAGECSEDSM
jgi:hypothetical protein